MLFALTMAISAFASTAAFALPEILDHVPSTFTATGANPEFLDVATKLSIKCEKLSISLANVKLTSATKIEGVIDFEQCRESTGGFSLISLGDQSDTTAPKLGLILVPFKGKAAISAKLRKKKPASSSKFHRFTSKLLSPACYLTPSMIPRRKRNLAWWG